MPRLKTESEVATISYLRHKTNIPVSTIYHYDSNPYNRLGGEFILMSKVRLKCGEFLRICSDHVTYDRHPESRFLRFIMGFRTETLSS